MPRAPKKPVGSSTLDAVAELPANPRAGWEIGACEVIRRLTVGSDKSLLALRDDENDGTALVVLRQLALPRSMAKEVARHAEWAARLHHPALARTFSNEETDEGYWWVTELVAGATFAELAVACRAEGKHVPTGLAVGAVLEAAQGLSEVHAAGSSHALVCDQSVAVAFDGTARLLDAGLFKCLAQQTSWAEVRSAMTPYFAPEQVLDGHAPDVRTDVYSLGMVLYEALSGEQALRGRSFEEVSRLHTRRRPALGGPAQRGARSPAGGGRRPRRRPPRGALRQRSGARHRPARGERRLRLAGPAAGALRVGPLRRSKAPAARAPRRASPPSARRDGGAASRCRWCPRPRRWPPCPRRRR